MTANYIIPATNLPLACRFGSIGEGLLRISKLQINSYKSSKGERIRSKIFVANIGAHAQIPPIRNCSNSHGDMC